MQPTALLSQVLSPDGRRCWSLNGRLFPVMAGAEDTPPSDPPANPPPPANLPPSDDEPFDKDRALATIKKLREGERQAKAQAKELDDLRAKVKAAEDAQLSEQDRLKKEAEEAKAEAARLKSERQAVMLRYEVRLTAQQLGFRDPEDAHRFLDTSGLDDLDEAELAKTIKSRLEAVLKEKDYLKAAPNGNGHAGVPATPRPAGAPNREQVVNEKVEALRRTGAYGRF